MARKVLAGLIAVILIVAWNGFQSQAPDPAPAKDALEAKLGARVAGHVREIGAWTAGYDQSARVLVPAVAPFIRAVATGEPFDGYFPGSPGFFAALTDVIDVYRRNSPFTSVWIVGHDGQLMAASTDARRLDERRNKLAGMALAQNEPLAGAVLADGGGVAVHIALPMGASDSGAGAVALFLSAPDSGFPRIHRVAAEGDGGFSWMIEHGLYGDDAFFRFDDDQFAGVQLTQATAEAVRARAEAFVADARGPDGTPAYLALAPVPGTIWVIASGMAQADVAVVEEEGSIDIVLIMGVLGVMAAIALFLVFRISARVDEDVEEETLAAPQPQAIATDQSLSELLIRGLNQVTDREFIGLKDGNGEYVYVNPTFARIIGRDAGDMAGLNDRDVFGYMTALRLEEGDVKALETRETVTMREEIPLDQITFEHGQELRESRLHHFDISKAPLFAPDGTAEGVMFMARDITRMVADQELQQTTMRQAVMVMTRAVEMHDPHLAGHSKRVADMSVAISRYMDLDDEIAVTVEAGALLSQVGKLGVPRELLQKANRLDSHEYEEVKKHIEHANKILKDIDFGLPVRRAVYEMYERLDGKGYPIGLKGEEISLPARILGVCDVFWARVETRSYRSGISPESAIEILEENAHRYDPEVVAALKAILGSDAGQAMLATLKPPQPPE